MKFSLTRYVATALYSCLGIRGKFLLIKEGAVLIGSFFPYLNKDRINKLLKRNIKIFSLELLPRITRAQSMDILSSQANLAGYKAVIDSVYEYNKAVPMMMTAAGTITPAKFFIIGAGVAGLRRYRSLC